MKRKRPPRREGVSSVGDLMQAVLDHYGVASDVRDQRIATEWRALVGARVAARAWPEQVRRGVLYVRVSSSAWLHELSFLASDLTKRINLALGDPPLVTEIRFHLGSMRRADVGRVATAHAHQERRTLERRPLPPPAIGAKLARIESEAARDVDDPELREVIAEARRRLNL